MRVLSYFLAAVAGAVVAALVLSFVPLRGTTGAAGPDRAAAIEAVVEKYLESHPEVVGKALTELQARQKSAALEEQHGAIKARAADLFRDPADQVLGSPDGDVTVVEFFDYRCPYCKRVLPVVLDTLKSDGRIRLVLKEFPILGPNSVLAAHAALASVKQGKYALFHTAMLTSNAALDEETIMSLAEAAGIDIKRLADDMKDPAIEALIKKNYELAQQLKIEGTPAFVIGDQLVPGALDRPTLERLVKDARAKG